MAVRTIYIETTLVSYLVARPSRDVVTAGHQEATRELWPKLAGEYDAYISALVYQEASRGDAEQSARRLDALRPFAVLDVDEEAQRLSRTLVESQGVPQEYPEDALHIAIAAVNGIDFLVTWNFAHLNNPFIRIKVREIVEHAGYRCPEICSPDELLEATE